MTVIADLADTLLVFDVFKMIATNYTQRHQAAGNRQQATGKQATIEQNLS